MDNLGERREDSEGDGVALVTDMRTLRVMLQARRDSWQGALDRMESIPSISGDQWKAETLGLYRGKVEELDTILDYITPQ